MTDKNVSGTYRLFEGIKYLTETLKTAVNLLKKDCALLFDTIREIMRGNGAELTSKNDIDFEELYT